MKFRYELNMAAEGGISPGKLEDENCSKNTLRRLQAEVCLKLSCDVCPKYRCTSLKMYDEHMKSKKHLRRKLRKESDSAWFCEACKIRLPNDDEWVKHLVGQRHDKAMKRLSLEKIPTSKPITLQEIALLDESRVQEEDT